MDKRVSSRLREPDGALDSAAASLTQERLTGWPLVEGAQSLVHQRFGHYSCLYWWESPATAFRRRRGYCVQYNTALLGVLHRLGFDCALVNASRVRLAHDPDWRMGHVWVQVTIDGEVRDVCAGPATPDTGSVRFEALTPVRRFGEPMRLLTVVGTAMIVTAAVLKSAISRQPRPAWLHHLLT